MLYVEPLALTLFPMQNWNNCPVLESDPEKLSGEWIFKNTRVPVRALSDNLKSGASVDDFSDWFPGVDRGQVQTVLKFVNAGLAD